MKTKEEIKIAVVDDNHFDNIIVAKQLKEYSNHPLHDYPCRLNIHTYEHVSDFLDEMDSDTDLIFLDYHLDNNIEAEDIIPEIMNINRDSCVIVMSGEKSTHTVGNTIRAGAIEFIEKDSILLKKICFIVDDYLTKKYYL